MNLQTLPVSLPHPNQLLLIEPLDYPNPYDFHKPHRHDYFEIILIKSGHGHQFIDFSPYTISQGQIFTVYPGQVHLMKRDTAQGMLIQFRKDVFDFIHPLKHSHLFFHDPEFNLAPDVFDHLYTLTEHIFSLLQRKELSAFSIHKAYSYLQIILISLTELSQEKISMQEQRLATQFLSLLSRHINTKRKVSDYCELLYCSIDKLNHACKASLGKTPLKLIHEELLLEVRRLLLLNELSLKEIAYETNFDSPANFSGFIKTNTGLTPSELHDSLLQIYNL